MTRQINLPRNHSKNTYYDSLGGDVAVVVVAGFVKEVLLNPFVFCLDDDFCFILGIDEYGPLNLVIVFTANLHFQVYESAVFQLAVYVKAEKASISPFSP